MTVACVDIFVTGPIYNFVVEYVVVPKFLKLSCYKLSEQTTWFYLYLHMSESILEFLKRKSLFDNKNLISVPESRAKSTLLIKILKHIT